MVLQRAVVFHSALDIFPQDLQVLATDVLGSTLKASSLNKKYVGRCATATKSDLSTGHKYLLNGIMLFADPKSDAHLTGILRIGA